MSGKVAQKDKMTTANNIEQGRTTRKRFPPTPVYTPGKKAYHEIKDAETPLVKAIEKDSTLAPRLIRKRKLVRQITKFVKNNKQMERVEEEEEWFEC